MGDGRLEMLSHRARLTELEAEPPQQTDRGGIGGGDHPARVPASRIGFVLVDTFLAITSRRDERRYAAGTMPDAVVERILDAGRLAGSSRNRQPWTFHVLASREAVDRLAAAVSVPENVLAAALVVVITVQGGPRALFDAGRAAQNMLLAAWNDGVSSCPNGVTDETGARRALGLSDETDQLAIVLSFGIPEKPRDVATRNPSEWSARANRRPLDEVVRRVGS